MKNDTHKAGDWDFAGKCAPEDGCLPSIRTFSVGIFKWVPARSGLGVKRGKIIKRIRGYCSNPEEVYEKARQYIAAKRAEEANP